MPSVEARLEKLEQELHHLRDQHDIDQLMAQYCYVADVGYDGSGHDLAAFIDLFTEDADFDLGSGCIHGKAQLSEMVHSMVQEGTLVMHFRSAGGIQISGDSALGRWHGLGALYLPPRPNAFWSAVLYEITFQRKGGTQFGWLISRLVGVPIFSCDYDSKGWVAKSAAEVSQ